MIFAMGSCVMNVGISRRKVTKKIIGYFFFFTKFYIEEKPVKFYLLACLLAYLLTCLLTYYYYFTSSKPLTARQLALYSYLFINKLKSYINLLCFQMSRIDARPTSPPRVRSAPPRRAPPPSPRGTPLRRHRHHRSLRQVFIYNLFICLSVVVSCLLKHNQN
jgi:hypothetical protein